MKHNGGCTFAFFSPRPDKPLSANSYNLDCDPTWLQMTAWLYAVTRACSSVLNIDTQFIKAYSAWLMQRASWQHDKNCESDYEGHNAAKKHCGRGELSQRTGACSLDVNARDIM